MTSAPIVLAASATASFMTTKDGLLSSWNETPILIGPFLSAAKAVGETVAQTANAEAATAMSVTRG